MKEPPRRRSASGREAAKRHIREAQKLSAELGGTDEDVKAYFFRLSPRELGPILDAYERAHGALARQYAEETIPKWKSGRVIMSGMIASRLFRLLPPRMPLDAKYHLTRNLWVHVGPSSRKRVRVGRNASLDEVLLVVRTHMADVVVHYKVPTALERRFKWLAARDVQLKQLLLNRLLDEDRELVMRGIEVEFPVLQRHFSGSGGKYTQRLVHTVKIGKHEIEMTFDRSIEGVRLEDPVPAREVASQKGTIRCWVAAGAVLLLVLFLSYQ